MNVAEAVWNPGFGYGISLRGCPADPKEGLYNASISGSDNVVVAVIVLPCQIG